MSTNPIIFGLDILAQANRGKKSSIIFSLVVLQANHLDKYAKINKRGLFQRIKDLRPDLIAMDNIFELAPNFNGIIRFLNIIPPTTRLVQVTGNPRTGMEKVTTLVRKHRIQRELSFPFSSQKMSAIQTAEVCARLCQKRVGHEIVAFEEEIRIVVSKKKSHGKKGGSSAPRYERIGRTAIHQAAAAVEGILREKGYSWEDFEYPRRRVYFTQLDETSIAEIRNLIKPLTTDLVRVVLERVTKSSLDFQPLDVNLAPASRTLHNIVLGIDPGTTTGIAVLNLMNGKVLFLGSKRECGISQIIRIASKYGKISCVAADVIPVPSTVEKVAKITGAKLKYPSVLASAATKRDYLHDYQDLTINFGHLNSHERDALFAAIKAYNSLKEQLSKIDRIVKETRADLIDNLPEIQRLVLSGNNISNAIEVVDGRIRAQDGNTDLDLTKDHLFASMKHENELFQSKIEAIYEEMDKLDQEVDFWQKQARKNKPEIKYWKNKHEQEQLKRSRIKHREISEAVDREVGRIIDENKEIRRKLRENQIEMEKLKQIKNFWVQGREIPLKVIKSFDDSSIRETEKNYGLHDGDIVLVLNPSGGGAQTALKIVDIGIRGIIVPKGAAKFADQALTQFVDNCLPLLHLTLKQFSERDPLQGDRELELWEYEGLYLTDMSIKEEIRKKEFILREYLRQRKIAKLQQIESKIDIKSNTELNIDHLLEEFKKDFIVQYNEGINEYYLEEE